MNRGFCVITMLCLVVAFLLGIGEREAQCKAVDGKIKHEWESVEGQYCRVYYKNNADEGTMVMRAGDAYFPMVAADFGWQPREKPVFVLYNDKKEMAAALGLETNIALPMGAYQGGRIAVLSPRLWAEGNEAQITETFLEKGPVSHELVHFAMSAVVGRDYPYWLGEGVALYYENKYTGFEWRPDLHEESKKLNVKLMETDFQSLPTALAYRKSYELVRAYVAIYGEKGLQEYIGSFALY